MDECLCYISEINHVAIQKLIEYLVLMINSTLLQCVCIAMLERVSVLERACVRVSSTSGYKQPPN